jgi:gamma-glutamylcyclotransferase
MRFWHYVSQAILAQDPLTTSLSATPSISSTSSTLSTSSKVSPANSIESAMVSSDNSTTNTTLYFGYGSNLWLKQMHNRCPNSTYLGIARLDGYKWIINERGYANVVEIERLTTPRRNALVESNAALHLRMKLYESEVWGLVYSLQPGDEARLDKNEGVPVAYTKEMLRCDFWPASDDQDGDPSKPAKKKRAKKEKEDLLVYINRDDVTPSKPKEEYVYRMNMGIQDAIEKGVPEGYVEEVMRKYIPEMEEVGEVVEVAKRQATESGNER